MPAGLHLLRYLSAASGGAPPRISLRARKRDELDLIDPDGGFGRHMEGPGDFLILRASDDSVVEMTSEASVPNGSVAANLSFQRLDTSIFRTPAQTSSEADFDWDDPEEDDGQDAEAGDAPALEILGHVSRRGDVVVKEGQWLGGPEAPAVIEGLELRWLHKPRGVALSYGAAPSRGDEQPLGPAGSFVGTRGRAKPLKFLQIELTGPSASRYELDLAAVFLGSPIKHLRGRSIVLRGPAGTEPLVGLRVALVDVAASTGESRVFGSSLGAASRNATVQTSDVKIFRRSAPRGKASER